MAVRPVRWLASAAFGALVVALALAVRGGGGNRALSGFTDARAAVQRETEAAFLDRVSADRMIADHAVLAAEPHVAGSARDRLLAEWTRSQWLEAGLDTAEIVEHEVLLPYPEEVSVELTAPHLWQATLREDPVPGDPYTQADNLGIPHHAYSASGEVEAEVVYAGSGNPEDYDWLAERGIDVRGRIALVRYSVPYSYRGFKALTAQQRGAAGLLIYSDPADDGSVKGAVYPDGPWGNDSHIQRGAIVYDFLVPGDPLTPGWPSVPGARRIPPEEAVSLPAIMSAPLSGRDARVILEALGGPEAPATWQGGFATSSDGAGVTARSFRYRVGAGPARVRLRVRMDDRVRPVWTVIGRLEGTDDRHREVIVGNHRDAWIYGGVDPSSGSAALMEMVRTVGALAREGRRPRRTLVFASWDAEEFTLTSSTEWGEQEEARLRERGVAYLNVDSAASGPDLQVSAVPSLAPLLVEAARAVRDPASGTPLLTVWRDRVTRERGTEVHSPVETRLGSGSDYTVFLNFIGMPIADLTFDGPYGVYHSVYDNHYWVTRIGDPGFRYHVALVQFWGLVALRLANADVLPLDPRAYAARIAEFVEELDRRWLTARPPGAGPGTTGSTSPELEPARAAAARFSSAAVTLASDAERARRQASAAAIAAINDRLMALERALLDPAGIPGRPWYRHQIYAPRFTYAPEILPGIAAAIDAGDVEMAVREAERLGATLDRATAALAGR